MLALLFVVLFLACVLAPFAGADSSDARSESAHPAQGWFPALR